MWSRRDRLKLLRISDERLGAEESMSKVGIPPPHNLYKPHALVAGSHTYIDRLNGLKVNTNLEKIESLFKCQSHFYNVQRNDYVKQRGMKLRWNNNFFHH